MGEALHTVLGSLHHAGAVELLMVALCLANCHFSHFALMFALQKCCWQWQSFSGKESHLSHISLDFIPLSPAPSAGQPNPKILIKCPFIFLLSRDMSTWAVITKMSSPGPWFFLPATSYPVLSSMLQKHRCMWGQVQCPLPVLVAQENLPLSFLITRPELS